MGNIYDTLMSDVRLQEGLKACINCGTCTAICPAAEFYNYDPRMIADTVQTRDDAKIIQLLKSETIWYCGECMSCKTRCPRGNAPGLIIIALRSMSQDLGYFVESEKGRQQLAIKRSIGDTILKYGYCVHIDVMTTELHPEQGPVWEWYRNNREKVLERMNGNYGKSGPGTMRKISDETLAELKQIFEVTGAIERFRKIESLSSEKAHESGIAFSEGQDEYFMHVYTACDINHS